MITKAYKYCIDYTGEWYVYKYFGFRLEEQNFMNLINFWVRSLDNDYIMINRIVKFQYLGEFNIEIDEKNNIKEVSKV